MAGKLACQGVVNAVHPGSLLQISDQLTGVSYVVDTGSTFCIIPYKSTAAEAGPRLKSATGRHIPCWGRRSLTLKFHGRLFTWDFLLADISFPILGIDFLQGWASVLFKRTFRSLRSFAFFIKECSVLCVLYKRTFRSFRSFPFFIKERNVLFYVLFVFISRTNIANFGKKNVKRTFRSF